MECPGPGPTYQHVGTGPGIPVLAAAETLGPSSAHQWTGTSPRSPGPPPQPSASGHQLQDNHKPTACCARTHSTHQQASTSSETSWPWPSPPVGQHPLQDSLDQASCVRNWPLPQLWDLTLLQMLYPCSLQPAPGPTYAC